MARRKDPEGTLNLILDVAEELFLKKGYERTSIQDILNQLGGLSKGAIYHHFKSKDDIFIAVSERANDAMMQQLDAIAADPNLTGFEKLKTILRVSAQRTPEDPMIQATPRLLENPHLLAAAVRNVFEDVAPHYIQPLIEDGVRDGSIATPYPKQLAEAITVLVNVWLNPMVIGGSREDAEGRIQVFDRLMAGVGLAMDDEAVVDDYVTFCSSITDLQTQSSPQSSPQSPPRQQRGQGQGQKSSGTGYEHDE